jgi:PAS domain S-box-containing protein
MSAVLDTSSIDAWVLRAFIASSSTIEALELALDALRDALGARGVASFGVERGEITCEVGEVGRGGFAVGSPSDQGPVSVACATGLEVFEPASGAEAGGVAPMPALLVVPILANGSAVAAIALVDPEVEVFGAVLDETTIAGRKLAHLVAEVRSDRRRRAAETALARSEQRYRLVAQAAGDVLRVWDVDADQIEWSDGLEPTLGVPPATVARHADWLARVHPDDRARVEDGFRNALAEGADEWSTEYRFQHGNGHFRTVTDRACFGTDGARASLVGGAMTDVTDRRKIEGRMLLGERLAAVGTLAAGVAHEINNPLSFVVANLAFIGEEIGVVLDERGTLSDEQAEILEGALEALDEARGGLDRVRSIVSDLRTFARGDGGGQIGYVEVEAPLESAIRMIGGQVREVAHLVRRYRKVPRVEADPTRLEQIFLALLVNAMQAIEEGKPDENEILVSTRTDEHGKVVVEIADSGVGMSRELMARIFDPFFTTKPLGIGTGLGLSICHGLVRSIGGEIFVDSRVGFGSTFRVTLPSSSAAASAPTSSSRLASAPPAPLQGRVLIVDDEASVLSALHRALSGRHEVVVLQSGRSALDLLSRDADFDVVLTDVSLPDLSGLELRAALATRAPALAERVVFMLSGAPDPSVRAALRALPNPSFEKPLELGALRTLVQERVEARRR